MGSVKDLKVSKTPSQSDLGLGMFSFSDRYSIFDWGEMPDTIPHKGKAIAILGAFFFEKLEQEGIKTHYKGLVYNNLTTSTLELKSPTDIMMVSLVNVYKPTLNGNNYDYSIYKSLKNNYLIPLEIIYRNYLPKGSSVFNRLSKGEISFKDLGLDTMPEPDTKLTKPMIDFSTKLEITDRYISHSNAQEISALSSTEMNELKKITNMINDLISHEFKRIGAINLDGKIETAFNLKREIILVDVLGTLDECRFDLDGLSLSKEAARIYYRNSEWHKETERAKEKDRQNWKKECKIQPSMLPKRFKELLSYMYCEVTNEVTRKKWFNVPMSLSKIVSELKGFVN